MGYLAINCLFKFRVLTNEVCQFPAEFGHRCPTRRTACNALTSLIFPLYLSQTNWVRAWMPNVGHSESGKFPRNDAFFKR